METVIFLASPIPVQGAETEGLSHDLKKTIKRIIQLTSPSSVHGAGFKANYQRYHSFKINYSPVCGAEMEGLLHELK